ncbi:hypothetical protein HDU85_005302 [Gaertneriomyces sp. JEL0708]|nr:hypothetical protein HDU85_005302 [Gaertneriomyces sp. JEL0708]
MSSGDDEEAYTGYDDLNFEIALSRGSQASAALSIIGAFSVIVTYFLIRKYQPKLAHRVSLRLAVAIAASDLISAIFYLVAAIPIGPSRLCAPAMFLNVSFLLMSLFSTSAIALNILLVFVLKIPARKNLERRYYIGSGIAALVIPFIALVTGRFGWNGSECWYLWSLSESYRLVVIWQWATYYVWVVLVILFCTICTALFWWSVRRPVINTLPDTPQHTLGINDKEIGVGNRAIFSETDRLVRRAVSRIKYYCAVPVITQTLTVALDVEFMVKEDNNPRIWLASAILLGLHGFVNSLVFFIFDPSVERAREKMRLWFIYRYYLRHFEVGTAEHQTQHQTQASQSQVDYHTYPVPSTMTRVGTPTNILAYHLCRKFLVREIDLKRFAEGVLDKRHNRGRSSKAPPSANASMARLGTVKATSTPLGTTHAVDAMMSSDYTGQDHVNSALAAL